MNYRDNRKLFENIISNQCKIGNKTSRIESIEWELHFGNLYTDSGIEVEELIEYVQKQEK